jgi:hypothetical protein
VYYALTVTSRYLSDPANDRWTAGKNILKYFRRTKDIFLIYGNDEELVIRGYTDASLVTDSDGFQSQSGYVFIINGGTVS